MTARVHELVLVGGGHAHVQVLRGLAMRPLAGVHATLVVDEPIAVYSGMVPGFVAGQYRRDELEIDVRPLARRAGVARGGRARDRRRRGRAAHRSRGPRGASLRHGVLRHRLHGGRARPARRARLRARDAADRALRRVDRRGDRARAGGTRGARRRVRRGRRRRRAGVRAAGAARARAARPTRSSRSSTRGRACFRASRRAWQSGSKLRRARAGSRCAWTRALQESKRTRCFSTAANRIPFDALIWATGAASHPLFRASALPTDERGFVRVRPDAASRRDTTRSSRPAIARASNPISRRPASTRCARGRRSIATCARAFAAMRCARTGRRATSWCCSISATARRSAPSGDAAPSGTWVFALKDRIDRRFVERFQVLDAGGAATRAFPPMAEGARDGLRRLRREGRRIGVAARTRATRSAPRRRRRARPRSARRRGRRAHARRRTRRRERGCVPSLHRRSVSRRARRRGERRERSCGRRARCRASRSRR